MNHRTAFIIAAALTAFVLIFVGGIAVAVTPKAIAFNPSPTPTDAPTQTSTSTLAPTQPPSPTSTRTQVSAPVPSILLPAQASKIALRLAPSAKLQKEPELVNYKGRMAYEVLFDMGTVYIDAFSGKVLFNGIGLAPTPAPLPPQIDPGNGGDGGGGGGGGHHGGGGGGNPAPNPGPVVPPSGGGGSGGHGGHDDGGHGGGGGDD